MNTEKINYVFFGTSEFSVMVLDELEAAGYVPSVVICTEDKPAGRKMILTSPPAKIWAEKRNVKVFQPQSLRENKLSGITEKIKSLSEKPFDLFIVASYGNIIPQAVLDIPIHGTLNVHPSLLPKLRGASPIESAILIENKTGVTIMQVDAEMDHGPIVAQEQANTAEWPEYFDVLEKQLAQQGGKLLVKVIPDWILGKITPVEQNDIDATLCGKIHKESALLDLTDSAEKNLRKICAFNVWPRAYFFLEKNGTKTRIIVTQAHITDGQLVITKIIPEGKKEMNFDDFERNLKSA